MSIKNLKLITETRFDFDILEEGSGDNKDLYVVGIFSSAEIENANGRKYRKDTLEREVKRIQEEHFKTGIPLYGTLGHPEAAETNLEKVAIRTTALEWRGNDLYGKSEVLKGTPCGDIAATLLKKSKLGISSRGLGQVDEDGYVNNESYKLLTWDLVSNASNYPSWVNGVYEGKTFTFESPKNDEEILEDLQKNRDYHFNHIRNLFEKWKASSKTVDMKEVAIISKSIKDLDKQIKEASPEDVKRLQKKMSFYKKQFESKSGKPWG
jgi:hypothetical protein